MWSNWRPKYKWFFGAVVAFILAMLLVPIPKDETAYSRAVYDSMGQLLSATTSRDGQWALPISEEIPKDFASAIVLYEDEYFGWHPGVNPVSLVKAALTNAKAGKIKRGASTLAMQVMRMRNKHVKRSIGNKLLEIVGAVKYTSVRSQTGIVRDWVAMAPFGGNTVGAEAAALRYYGRNLSKLSWAEYALLAVLPNNPTGVNVFRQKEKLKAKRDQLLTKLADHGHFSPGDLEVYKDEDLPSDLFAIPQRAYHFLRFCALQNTKQFRFESSIDGDLQDRLTTLVQNESTFLQAQDINNAAAVVIDITNNSLKAYIGNVGRSGSGFAYNDLVQAKRSYGSLLKPLLYAFALEQSYRLPGEMLADIPTSIGDFRPENFDKKYRGAVPFDEALIQSLNVPMVRQLNEMGYYEFYKLLNDDLKIAGLDKGADHYGLSIILGGGETSLWELSRVYKGLARNYAGLVGPYDDIRYLKKEAESKIENRFSFGAYGVSHLVQAMTDLTRPREEKSWELYAGQKKIAWKTGTSFGHRDAWAIGFSGKYMVGVWVGNETGASRPDLTGVLKAAPIMFNIFNQLSDDQWFDVQPSWRRGALVSYCKDSGMLAGKWCKHTAQLILPSTSYRLNTCSYHEVHRVDEEGFLVSEACEAATVRTDTIFTLPPLMAYFYEQAHDDYSFSHRQKPGCATNVSAIKIIYPTQNLKIFLPRESRERKPLFAQAYQEEKSGELYWFLDGKHIAEGTAGQNAMCRLDPGEGRHHLLVTDSRGNKGEVYFDVLGIDATPRVYTPEH